MDFHKVILTIAHRGGGRIDYWSTGQLERHRRKYINVDSQSVARILDSIVVTKKLLTL
jgi:hypothetical protein